MSHQLDCRLFKLQPRQHHVVNLCWHIAGTVCLFLVLRRMTGEEWRPALVAALFGLHPLHVESVAWVSERKDVLSSFFAISTLGMYTLYAARPSPVRYLAVLTAFMIGLLCKPMLVTWPFVLLLMDYWPLRRCPLSPSAADAAGSPDAASLPRFAPAGWTRLAMEKLPLLALAVASSLVTMLAQKRAMRPGEHLTVLLRLENALVSYATYLRKTVWPMDLAAFYQHQGTRLPLAPVIESAIVLLILSLVVVLGFRRRPALLVGWLWYLGTLVPVIGLVQVGVQSMADRYTYLPLIGIFMALAWSIPPLPETRRAARALVGLTAGVLLLACTVLTFRQTQFWRDDEPLWRRVLVVAESPYGHCNYALVLANLDRPDEAERHFEIALRMDPKYLFALTLLGDFRLNRGDLEQALAYYREALAVAPDNAGVHGRLGLVFACMGRNQEARREFETVSLHETEKDFHHYNLAAVLDRLGDRVGAEREYEEGRRLDPNYIETARASAEDFCGGKYRRKNSPGYALFLAEQACGAGDAPRVETYQTLAKAFAVNRRPLAAYFAIQRALEFAETQGRSDLLPGLREQLHSYEPPARRSEARAVALALTAPAFSSPTGSLFALAILADDRAEHRLPGDFAR